MLRSFFIALLFGLFVGAGPAAVESSTSKFTWQMKRQLADLVIWQHRESKGVRASSQWKEGRSKLLEQKNIVSFIKKLEAKKTQGLNLTGIKNWKVESSSWDEKSQVLTLKGHYNDRKNREVKFVELHCFEDNSRSIHVITSKSGSSIDSDEISSLLEQARTLGSPE